MRPKSIGRFRSPRTLRLARPPLCWLRGCVTVSAAGLLGLPLLFAVPEGVSGQVTPEPTVLPADGSCRVLYRGPEMLRLPGNRVTSVDAQRLDASESGELLLSGLSLWDFMLDDAGIVIEEEEASYVGVLFHLDGTARPLPSPDLQRHLRVRWAVPRGEGGWEVVFAETASRPESIADPPWIGLWYGVFDGREWKTFDPLPFLPELMVSDGEPIPLVVKNGSVMWVEMTRDRTGKSLVAILGDPERSWSFQAFHPSPSGRPYGGSYPRLGSTDEEGLVLAVIQPDSSLPEGWSQSTVYFYRLGREVGLPLGTPELIRRVADGEGGATYGPVIAFSDQEAAIGWRRALPPDSVHLVRGLHEAKALADPFGNAPATLHLGSGVSMWRRPSVHVLPDGALLWAVHRWVPREAHPGDDLGRFVLRLLRQKGGGIRLLGEFPSPFDWGGTNSGVVGPELVVAGSIRAGPHSVPTSQIARYRVECKE